MYLAFKVLLIALFAFAVASGEPRRRRKIKYEQQSNVTNAQNEEYMAKKEREVKGNQG